MLEEHSPSENSHGSLCIPPEPAFLPSTPNKGGLSEGMHHQGFVGDPNTRFAISLPFLPHPPAPAPSLNQITCKKYV